jgi:hypothetical protein
VEKSLVLEGLVHGGETRRWEGVRSRLTPERGADDRGEQRQDDEEPEHVAGRAHSPQRLAVVHADQSRPPALIR